MLGSRTQTEEPALYRGSLFCGSRLDVRTLTLGRGQIACVADALLSAPVNCVALPGVGAGSWDHPQHEPGCPYRVDEGLCSCLPSDSKGSDWPTYGRLLWARLVEVTVDIEPFVALLHESSTQFDIPPSTRLPLLMTLQRLVVTRVDGPRLQEEGCPMAHVAGRAFPECWFVSGPLD